MRFLNSETLALLNSKVNKRESSWCVPVSPRRIENATRVATVSRLWRSEEGLHEVVLNARLISRVSMFLTNLDVTTDDTRTKHTVYC